MSNSAGDSSGSVPNGEAQVNRSRCWCGSQVVLRKSKTAKNPNRWFYRCELAAMQKMKGDNHTFQWVDGGSGEQPLEMSLLRLQQEVSEVKLVIERQADYEKQFKRELEMRVDERIDDAVNGFKSSVRKEMLGYFIIGCMISYAFSKFLV